MKYDKISGMKYRVLEEVSIDTTDYIPGGIKPKHNIDMKFGVIGSNGIIKIDRGFLWDGPTGAFDTPETMLPSLFHDIGCDAIDQELLDDDYRRPFDDLFYGLLIEEYKKNDDEVSNWQNRAEEIRADYMRFAVVKWGEIKH